MTDLSTRQRLSSRIFKAIHHRNLIYNTCWEDPALDRIALQLGPADRVMVIASAGCNALDYLLAGAGEVHAVDVNPIQISLLELKRAGILGLDHSSFFELFGQGRSPYAREMYHDAMRPHLSSVAQAYWDRKIKFFRGRGWRKSFYYRGTSGLLAKLVLMNVQLLHRMHTPIERLLAARTIDEQRAIYERDVEPRIWSPWLMWFLSRSFTLTLLGVPWPQRDQITTQYPGGVSKFIRDALEAVLCKLPFHSNYFWRVYFQGYYTPDCCPEYLRAENFEELRSRIGGLHLHTSTVTEFLRQVRPGLTRFVLLDHMDWMSCVNSPALAEEWEALLASAAPGARAIFRSAGLQVSYLDQLPIRYRGHETELGGLLRYHPEWSAELHARDRVHTYGSFSIADLPT